MDVTKFKRAVEGIVYIAFDGESNAVTPKYRNAPYCKYVQSDALPLLDVNTIKKGQIEIFQKMVPGENIAIVDNAEMEFVRMCDVWHYIAWWTDFRNNEDGVSMPDSSVLSKMVQKLTLKLRPDGVDGRTFSFDDIFIMFYKYNSIEYVEVCTTLSDNESETDSLLVIGDKVLAYGMEKTYQTNAPNKWMLVYIDNELSVIDSDYAYYQELWNKALRS